MAVAVPGAAMLDVTGLHVAYGETVAVQGVDFSVADGEIVSLIGSNGAGKSTTLKAIQGLLAPRAGRVALEGRDVTGWPPDRLVRQGMAISPEGRRVFPQMTVQENLEIGGYVHGRSTAEQFAPLFEAFPILRERRTQLAGSLSGGEQQMLAIARALVARPRLLLLDEPSLGLAPRMIERIWETIQDINRRGITILLVEQNAHLALSLAHRVYLMERGRTVLSGPSETMRRDPRVIEIYLGGRNESAERA